MEQILSFTTVVFVVAFWSVLSLRLEVLSRSTDTGTTEPTRIWILSIKSAFRKPGVIRCGSDHFCSKFGGRWRWRNRSTCWSQTGNGWGGVDRRYRINTKINEARTTYDSDQNTQRKQNVLFQFRIQIKTNLNIYEHDMNKWMKTFFFWKHTWIRSGIYEWKFNIGVGKSGTI